MLNCLAIIPARKNSKGLKHKNKLNFDNKPLFYWPIIAAINSKIFDKIVLTTDDQEIIDKSEYFKNKIIRIKRPRNISTDNSKSIEYIRHTVLKLKESNLIFKYIILLEPTSPLTDSDDVKKIHKILTSNKNTSSVVSVQNNIKYHPNFNFRLSFKNNLIPFHKKIDKRRQDISKMYYLDGSIYASKVSTLLKYNSFIQKNTKPFFSNLHKFIEIDDKFDFELAEIIKKFYVK